MTRFLFISIILAGLVGCNETLEQIAEPQSQLTVNISGLSRLGPGEGRYELWANFFDFNKTGSSSSTLHSEIEFIAAFNIATDGKNVVDGSDNPISFQLPEGKNPQLLDDIFIVLRRAGDTGGPVEDDVPPGSIIIGGSFTGNIAVARANLNTAYAKVFGTDFSALMGTYTILTPTSPILSDSLSGIWFYRNAPVPGPSLIGFPNPPQGWTYEGWLVQEVAGVKSYFSTGKFTRVDTADFDGAGPGRGPDPGLNVPGQDFITGTPSGLNLTSFEYSFMITLEPFPDNSYNPYSITLLSSTPVSVFSLSLRDGEMFNAALVTQPSAQAQIIR